MNRPEIAKKLLEAGLEVDLEVLDSPKLFIVSTLPKPGVEPEIVGLFQTEDDLERWVQENRTTMYKGSVFGTRRDAREAQRYGNGMPVKVVIREMDGRRELVLAFDNPAGGEREYIVGISKTNLVGATVGKLENAATLTLTDTRGEIR